MRKDRESFEEVWHLVGACRTRHDSMKT